MSTVQLKRWSREDYDRMIEAGIFAPGERVELIDGEIVEMSPQHSEHSTAVSLSAEALRVAFGVGNYVRVQMPLALDAYSEPEPDVAVVPGSPRDYRDAHPTTALLVVEVADSTEVYDRAQKGSLYARAGVADYWLLNLRERQLEVYRAPVRMAQARYGWGYESVQHSSAADIVSPLAAPQARIAVADLLP
ncbi:MAG TPA: Uma2 family endonuclease [Alphaproteobacteria bacterium]|nr:Uma2 family endonuclease [Alphaproteobacteria bacterium]